MVQLREKSLDDRSIIERAVVLKRVCNEHGVPFILNDRPDLALAAGSDGVHVGQDDLRVSVVRKIVGQDAIVGLSTHCDEDLDGALNLSVDYISAGPMVETPTKPQRRGTGVAYAAHASSVMNKPVFATGGITGHQVHSLVKRGITRFVVVRALTQSSTPYETAREIRRAIELSMTTSQPDSLSK